MIKTIFFVSRDLPISGNGGSSTYRLSLLSYLESRGYNVQYILLPYLQNNGTISQSNDNYVDSTTAIRVRQLSHTNASNVPVWNGSPTNAECSYILGLIDSYAPELVIVDRTWLCGLFQTGSTALPYATAVLTHDVNYTKIKQYLRFGVYPFKRNNRAEQPAWNREIEKHYLEKVDVVIAIQRADQELFTNLVPTKKVTYTPSACVLRPVRPHEQVPGRILFVGGSTQHNIIGLQWLVTEVWPKVIRAYPHATLAVCGEVCTAIPDNGLLPSHVLLKGKVEKLDQEYAEAEVCVVPLLIGGGLKIKLVEAMSYGRACVATTIGVQGIEEVERYGVSVTNDSSLFSTALQHLLANKSKRLSYEKQNRTFVTNYLSPEKVYGAFIEAVQSVLANKLR